MHDGFDPHFDESRMESFPVGHVIKKQRGEYTVFFGNREYECTIRSRLRKNLVYPLSRQRRQSVDRIKSIEQVDPVAIGDIVRFNIVDESTCKGVIEKVEERNNQLSRRAPGPKPRESVICANIGTLFPIFSLKQPEPKIGLIDRILVVAEWEDIPKVIIFNKIDIAEKDDIDWMRSVYEPAGFEMLFVSALSGEGVEKVAKLMKGKTTVLVGPSGVGKTALLNAIQPGFGLKVGLVSESTGKGIHTTTHLEAFPLDFGGFVVDTPGIKQLVLWNLDPDDLITLFPEMTPLVGKCKFGLSCRHETEPGCAIKDAVEKGIVHRERYESYLRMHKSLPVEEY